MKKFISFFAAVLLFTSANAAIAHNASVVTISAPSNDQTIIVESLPVNIIVEGTISHGSPGNINGQRACVSIDGGIATCEPNYVGGLGNVSSRNFSITVRSTTKDSTRFKPLQLIQAAITAGFPVS